jgi:hypothetical protein
MFFYSAKADSFFDFYPLAQASGNLRIMLTKKREVVF